MKKKILWKIEELWSGNYNPIKISPIDVSKNYLLGGSSRYYDKFDKADDPNFIKSKKTVFTDVYGEYRGLKKYQVIMRDDKWIYLFDNHNEIIYPIVEIFESKGKKYDVVHIDAHPDNAIFAAEKPQYLDIKTIGDFISKTRISDFFDAISEANVIGDIFRVTHSDSLEFFLPPEKPYILSLDIDIFGPEGDFAELKDKVRAIALAWGGADFVCIAMSPGFIDQEYAKEIIKIFMR